MRIVVVKVGVGGGGVSYVLRVWPQSEEEKRFLASLGKDSPVDVEMERKS